jgi:hypothetical protein
MSGAQRLINEESGQKLPVRDFPILQNRSPLLSKTKRANLPQFPLCGARQCAERPAPHAATVTYVGTSYRVHSEFAAVGLARYRHGPRRNENC